MSIPQRIPAPTPAPRRSAWRRNAVSAVAILSFMTAAGVGLALATHPTKTAPAVPAGQVLSGPVAVSIEGFAFSQPSLTVKVGSVVTWTNADSDAHTVRTNADDTLHSGVLNTNDSYTVTFTKPGTYPYRCSIHPEMQATITVVN